MDNEECDILKTRNIQVLFLNEYVRFYRIKHNKNAKFDFMNDEDFCKSFIEESEKYKNATDTDKTIIKTTIKDNDLYYYILNKNGDISYKAKSLVALINSLIQYNINSDYYIIQ
jgi:hypothetical protein